MVPYKAQAGLNDPSLPACTVSAQFKFHQKSVYYTVVLFQKGLVALTVDSEQSYIDTVSVCCPGWHCPQEFLCYKTSQLPVFVCVYEGNISSAAFLTHSFCCTPKLKVNSTYWPHLERPFTCGESHPVRTRWQTEILIIPLLLSSEEVDTFFRAEQMSDVQFVSRVTHEMTNGSGPLCLSFFFFPYVCVWWEGWHLFVSMEIWEHEGIAMDTECPFGVPFWVALLCCKVYGVPLYLAMKHFPAFAELWGLWIISYKYNKSICLWFHICMGVSVCCLKGFACPPTADWFYVDYFLEAVMFL